MLNKFAMQGQKSLTITSDDTKTNKNNSPPDPVSNLIHYKSYTEKGDYVNAAFDDNENLKITDATTINVIEYPNCREKENIKSKSKDQEKFVSFLSLFRYSSNADKVLIFIAVIIAVLSGLTMPLCMIFFGDILDYFIDFDRVQHNLTTFSVNSHGYTDYVFLHNVSHYSMYVAIIGLVMFLVNYIFVSFFSISAANQAFEIKCLFMKSVLKQDISWFDTNQTGDFASRMTGDLSRIQDGIGDKLGICISFLSTAFFSLMVSFYYSWKLTLVCLCVMPILAIAMGIIAKIQSSVSTQEFKAYGQAGSVAEEVLSSIRTVAAFGGEMKEIERYSKCLLPAKKKAIKRGLLTSIGAALVWVCMYLGYAIAFWYGMKLVAENVGNQVKFKPSTLIKVFFNVLGAARFVGQTAPYFEGFTLARGAAAKLFSIIERKPPIDSSSDSGQTLDQLQGNISLDDVYFHYPARPDVPILRGLSLEIKSGETVALVGSSGCGKSTIVQLVQRFYDADQGTVSIDGNDIKTLNVGWLRDHIGLVGQEPVLFSTTIAKNIEYGKPGASQSEIELAAKLANVHRFINALPLKYETIVGEKGTQLSGGQKQRIAIARALIKNPKILLLDEATSALDVESESVVQEALDKAKEGRTTIIVAHRLSTIRTADKIVALSQGTVHEVGTHEELMDKKGIYYQLVMSQTNEVEEDIEDLNECDDVLEDLHQRERLASILTMSSCDSRSSSLPRNFKRAFSAVSQLGTAPKKADYEEKTNPESSNLRLLKMSSPEYPYLVVGSIASLIMGVFTPIYGIIFGDLIGVLSERKDQIQKDTVFYCVLFAILAACAGTVCFIQTYLFSIAGEKFTGRLRIMCFKTIISQDISFFDNPANSIGSLCTRLTSDASNVQGATGSRLSTILEAFSTLVSIVVIGFWYNYKIGFVVCCFIPLILAATYFESRIVGGQMLNEVSNTELASKVAIEAIENIRTVASLHQEESFCTIFRNALLESHKISRKNSHVRGVTFGFSQCVPIFGFTTALYYGAILDVQKTLKYSDLIKIIESVIFGTVILGRAVSFAPDYQKAKLSTVRIFKLLDMKPTIDIFSTTGCFLRDVKGSLLFKNIRFNYPSRPGAKILRGLNLEIEPGQTVALVGSSGCGKSTCIQLLERFYDTDQGDVILDDFSVKDLNVSHLRSKIGLVSQEPVLFSYSFAENIAYGDNSRHVGMDEIIEAAKQANIHNFISSLPLGYDTPAGDRGTQLSGGQKQRIAIARALLRNPKILLLDEATSALDVESEKVVQDALDKASEGRTCLIIAHRLTTIQNADKIVVIHRGRVVEKGTHQELINRRGRYYNLHNMQMGAR